MFTCLVYFLEYPEVFLNFNSCHAKVLHIKSGVYKTNKIIISFFRHDLFRMMKLMNMNVCGVTKMKSLVSRNSRPCQNLSTISIMPTWTMRIQTISVCGRDAPEEPQELNLVHLKERFIDGQIVTDFYYLVHYDQLFSIWPH